jgi:hypothetical protein
MIMGLDITIYPEDYFKDNYCTDCLKLDREEELFKKIVNYVRRNGLHTGGFRFKGDRYSTDRYGKAIKSVTSVQLRSVMQKAVINNWKNEAVKKYLAELMPDVRVHIFYH